MQRHTLVVTRPSSQADLLIKEAESRQLNVLKLPAIQTITRSPDAETREIIRNLTSFTWIVFTSANGVSAFAEILGRECSLPQPIHCATQGVNTAKYYRELFGREPDLIPKLSTSLDLAKELLLKLDIANENVLIVAAAHGRKTLQNSLEQSGAKFSVILAYDTQARKLEPETLANLGKLDPKRTIFSFFSPSAFNSIFEQVPIDFLVRSKIASIGPVTSEAIIAQGLMVNIEAPEQNDLALLDAVCAFTLSCA